MPWAILRGPSIQLSTVKALLAKSGIGSKVFNFNLEWMEHLTQNGFSVRDYVYIGQASRGMGEWIFAVPPFRDTSPTELEEYRSYFVEDEEKQRRVREELFAGALRMRELVPSFIDRCVEKIVAEKPRVAGFTTTFQQNVPTLYLVSALKRAAPEIVTVLGGANCDGVMGSALHRSFSFIDVVVRGEAEAIVGPLFGELVEGTKLTPLSGLCYREKGERIEVPQTAPLTQMDDVPMPDHDDYFRDAEAMSYRTEISPPWIPFESARGCWWGQKHHCTFCGLNGTSMKFRSKSPERTLDELETISRKYRVTHFRSTDNIIEMGYFESFLPEVEKRGHDWHLFYETKSNLKKSQVAGMAAAGVLEIQPGIETLSTPILELMKKGTTALQNIRLLKWALEHRIEVRWNLLYGFPGETPEQYAQMAALVPSLLHLEPPAATLLEVHRFSPYHAQTARYALKVKGPKTFYRHIYALDEATVSDIAYSFEHEYTTPQEPKVYVKPLLAAVDAWNATWKESKLEYRRGPGFLEILDTRGGEGRHHHLGEIETKIYLSLDASATANSVAHELAKNARHGEVVPTAEQVEAFLRQLVDLRLVYEEGGRYLSLAIPARRPR